MEEFNPVLKKLSIVSILLCVLSSSLVAQKPSEMELEIWNLAFEEVVEEGEENFNDPGLSNNGMACGQCHVDGANTRPETYPKFKKNMDRVVTLAEMINWCIVNPLKGKALELDSEKMVSLITYITHQRRDVKLNPGKN